MSKEQLTWRTICCHVLDVIEDKGIKENSKTFNIHQARTLVSQKYATGSTLEFGLLLSLAKDLAWADWFNEHISEHTGYKIDKEFWETYALKVIMTVSTTLNANSYGFLKAFDWRIDIEIINEKKFTVSILNKDLKRDELMYYKQGNINRCGNITPVVVDYAKRHLYPENNNI